MVAVGTRNAPSYQEQVAKFNMLTRNRTYTLDTKTRSTNGGDQFSWPLPPLGLIARIRINIVGTINVLTGAPNVMGQSAIIKTIRLSSNMGYDLFNLTGPQYFGLFAPVIDAEGNSFPSSTAWTAIASAGAVNLPVVIPLAVNMRDVTGLLPAQNRQTVLTLYIETETDANLAATSITWTAQPAITPEFEYFTIPFDINAQPPINMLHKVIGMTESVPAAGEFRHTWESDIIVLQKLHGLGFQVTTPADSWTYADLRTQVTDYFYHKTPNSLDLEYGYYRQQARRKGTISFDFIAQSGMGVYDIPRDALNTGLYTDVKSVINASGSGTLHTVTRALVPVR